MSEENENRLKEIIRKIDEKKHLIEYTKAISGTPVCEGGMSRERAAQTVNLFQKDILELEGEYKRIEPFGESINTSDYTKDILNKLHEEANKDIEIQDINYKLLNESEEIIEEKQPERNHINNTNWSRNDILFLIFVIGLLIISIKIL